MAAMIEKFKINTADLTSNEKLVLEKLILAAELLAPLYVRQKNDKHPGANFYPPDAGKKELGAAAKKNPAILSPYTFVEREASGKLVAVPYSVKFQGELKTITELLREAASLSQDENLKSYLEARAKDLLKDNYDQSNILWLKTERSKIGCVIGPFDRYLDKLFFKKRAYMAWIGVLDKKQTCEGEKLKAAVLTSEKNFLPRAKQAKIPEVRIRIEDTAIFSGLVADFMFVGNHLPSSADLYLITKYGTLFTLFNPSAERRFENWIYPIFKSVFSQNFQRNYGKEELYQAFLRAKILHETCHSLMRYKDATSRLQEYFPYFDEIYTDILGIKRCGDLLLKDFIKQRELENILLMRICECLYFLNAHKKQFLTPYSVGEAIFLNFLLGGKTLKKKDGAFQPDFGKLFICIDQLSHLLEYCLALGNYNEAKEFITKYGSFKPFQKHFEAKLSKIPRDI